MFNLNMVAHTEHSGGLDSIMTPYATPKWFSALHRMTALL